MCSQVLYSLYLLLLLPFLLILKPSVPCLHLHHQCYHHHYSIKAFQKQSKTHLISSHLISSCILFSSLSLFLPHFITSSLHHFFLFFLFLFHVQLFSFNPCNYVSCQTSYFLNFVSFLSSFFLFLFDLLFESVFYMMLSLILLTSPFSSSLHCHIIKTQTPKGIYE